MPASLQDVINWLIPAIENDATLNGLGVSDAYMYSSPEMGTIDSYPFVIIGKQADTHRMVMCGTSFDIHFMLVKVVDTGFDGGERARKCLHRVRQVIEFSRPPVTVASGKIDAIQPSSGFEYDEQESGNINFFHCVAVEKVTVSD